MTSPRTSADITHKGEVLETMQEVVEAISDHWRTVWENKDRDLRAKGITFQEQVDIVAKELEALGPPPLGDWKDPDGERVLKAFRNSGGSASADGWQGEEVKHFPAGVANKFALISKRWKRAKYAPVVLKAARQANLIKESKICKKTNTLEAGDTRPISVSSIWWRVYTTCWITCEELSHWRMHYFPEDVVFAENAESCGAKVCDKFRELGFLGTLDFSQCYDHVDPRLITEVLKRLHFPSDLADLLQDVWGKLIRYIQWNGHTGAVPLDAGKALMQGDSFGPFALNLLMASGTRWVQREIRRALPDVGRVFSLILMDDRNFASDKPEKICTTIDTWYRWSGILGLKENASKTKITAKSAALERQLREVAGDKEKYISNSAEVLGLVTVGQPRKEHDKEKARVTSGTRKVQRIRSLPVTPAKKASYCRVFGVSTSSYGWVAQNPNLKSSSKFTTNCYKTMGGSPNAARLLKDIIFGAPFQLDVQVTCRKANIVMKALEVNPDAFRWTNETGTIAKTLKNSLRRHLWVETKTPWRWRHALLRTILDLQNDDTSTCVQHKIREAWRAYRWRLFTQGGKRREARVIPTKYPYPARAVKRLRDWSLASEIRAVATGGFVSPSAYAVSCPEATDDQKLCVWCNGECATFHHMTWKCPRRPSELATPTCPVQRRLGWPTTNNTEYDLAVMAWIQKMVGAVWKRRYGDKFFRTEQERFLAREREADDTSADDSEAEARAKVRRRAAVPKQAAKAKAKTGGTSLRRRVVKSRSQRQAILH